MQVPMSSYLVEIKPQIQELIRLLEREFDYVNVLCTDVKGTTYRVSMHQTTVGDYHFCERGFVVRAWQDGSYTEYSFNNLTDAADLAEEITSALKSEFQALKALGIAQMESPLVQEESIAKTMQNEIGIDPETVSAEEILSHLRKLCDAGAAHEGILEFQSTVSFARVNKLFLSSKKDLMQSYAFSEGSLSAIGTENGKQNMSYRSCSGLKGVEILNEMDAIVEEIIAVLYDKLHSDPVTPGMYDVITAPDVTGVIAHEAFGHGVEMDMFVKDRALAKEYIGKPVASQLSSMHDGAVGAQQVSSYLFDDEGTLGTTPTGNGKRESFERKVYSRMTNTYFTAGTDKLDDMIASIDHGYLLESVQSGMEDPKHWGIQCMVGLGREIKDGKLTGKVVSPVTLTGYVPDLLKSISMVSDKEELFGSGMCGKGHKEWVKVSDGGPYLKCKVRLG